MVFLLFNVFFKIRKFKDGFLFLQNNENLIQNVGIIEFILCGVVLFTYNISSIISRYRDDNITFGAILTISTISLSYGIILWIRKRMYKQLVHDFKDMEITQLRQELALEREKVARLTEENLNFITVNHETKNIIKSLQFEVANMNIETSSELDVSTRLETLSKNYSKSLLKEDRFVKNLPKTNNSGIDNMLTFLSSECNKNRIEFILKLEDSINFMVEKFIPQHRLEILIGDLVTNSIIAINHSNKKVRTIMAFLGLTSEYYEFSIHDTGIPFEIDTLINLGLKPATTHADDNGTGIGFMSTFKTMQETKASLIIEEKQDSTFTKNIRIRFDGQNQYIIRSYRAEELKEHLTDNRIIIETL
jgi:hypothetical protein